METAGRIGQIKVDAVVLSGNCEPLRHIAKRGKNPPSNIKHGV